MGDSTARSVRLEKFSKADTNNDDFINFMEFLQLIYNFDTDQDEKSPRNLCLKQSEAGDFVSNSLTVPEQLQYGLF